MTSKKLQKFDDNRQIAEENIDRQLAERQDIVGRERALVALGGVAAVNHIASTLSSQVLRALQTIRDEKTFEQFGYTRFDDFLNESEYSPLTYRQFIDREKLLANEGERLFDLLNSSSLSNKQRKLLGNGYVQVDEDKGIVIVTTSADPTDDSTQEIELTDRNRLLQTLSALADQAATLQQKNARQKVQIERGEKQVDELRKAVDEARDRPGTVKPFDIWLQACRTIDAYAEIVTALPEEDRQNGEQYVAALQQSVERVKTAFAGTTAAIGRQKKSKVTADDGAEISLDDDDLAGLME